MPPSSRSPEASEELYYDELDSDPYLDDEPQTSRRNARLRWLFWVGTALAPIAAVMLVMGQGLNPLRAAAVLAILGVVCIGLSVTLRDTSSAAHAELAEDLQREVDEVRSELETLRRGVQLTVNRELGRVRGELEAAQQVLRTEATRLPAGPAAQRVAQLDDAPVAARASRSTEPPRRNQPRKRITAVADPTSAVPVAPRVPVSTPSNNASHNGVYGAPARRSLVHDDARAALQGGGASRVGGYAGFDSLASTASHPVVTQAAARRPLTDPYTVEPIREKYAAAPVPSQRSSSPAASEPSYAPASQLSRGGLNGGDPYGSDELYGEVLGPQRDRYDAGDRWSWASSTSTQDWQPDFDLPSLDGLPIPGYQAGATPQSSLDSRPVNNTRQQAPSAPSTPSRRRAGGGRHSADDAGEAPWYGG